MRGKPHTHTGEFDLILLRSASHHTHHTHHTLFGSSSYEAAQELEVLLGDGSRPTSLGARAELPADGPLSDRARALPAREQPKEHEAAPLTTRGLGGPSNLAGRSHHATLR